MADQKATPGPWSYTAKLSGSENCKGFIIRGREGYIIADIYPLDGDGIEGEANAILFITAPTLQARIEELEAEKAELLEVLKSIASVQLPASKWPKRLIGPFSVAYPKARHFEFVKKYPWRCVTYTVLDPDRGTSDRFIYNTKHKEWAEKICEILNDAWDGKGIPDKEEARTAFAKHTQSPK